MAGRPFWGFLAVKLLSMDFKNLLLLVACCLSVFLSRPAAAQEKIIFDTDFGADADDLGALAMLHGFIDSGEADLLAIMVWSTEASVIPAIDAVNRYYSHPDIPMGIRSGDTFTSDWNYNQVIAEQLPHQLTNKDVPEATVLYRKILAESEDQSIVLVTVGPLLNIKKLIESEPDSISPLSGKELLHRKVKEMVVMGGQYPEGSTQEWNFWGDMPGVTQFVFDHIELPVVFLGYEVGDAIKSGAVFNDIDPVSPLYIGFKHFSEHAPWIKENYRGRILPNSTFDQTAVLYAVRGGLGRWWKKVEGYNQIDEEGNNHWVEAPNTNQSYLQLTEKPETIARFIESLMLYNERP